MIGPYSVNQMDDFYAALARGEVKPTGIMNYLQHLLVAQRCTPGAHVIDVCCGRGLQLPVLYRYAPHISSYTGLDIAAANLGEARQRIRDLDASYGERPFPVTLIECDVAGEWPDLPAADLIIYTSALEHLPREQGAESLRHAASALAPGGRLYLSTPNTPGLPRRLQHRVHVYEWHHDELAPLLGHAGLVVEDLIGLLPPIHTDLGQVLTDHYGPGAGALYERLHACLPGQFADVVVSAAAGGAASELLYICRRRG
jgi:SAM-dependent methyltransferase